MLLDLKISVVIFLICRRKITATRRLNASTENDLFIPAVRVHLRTFFPINYFLFIGQNLSKLVGAKRISKKDLERCTKTQKITAPNHPKTFLFVIESKTFTRASCFFYTFSHPFLKNSRSLCGKGGHERPRSLLFIA